MTPAETHTGKDWFPLFPSVPVRRTKDLFFFYESYVGTSVSGIRSQFFSFLMVPVRRIILPADTSGRCLQWNWIGKGPFSIFYPFCTGSGS